MHWRWNSCLQLVTCTETNWVVKRKSYTRPKKEDPGVSFTCIPLKGHCHRKLQGIYCKHHHKHPGCHPQQKLLLMSNAPQTSWSLPSPVPVYQISHKILSICKLATMFSSIYKYLTHGKVCDYTDWCSKHIIEQNQLDINIQWIHN